MTAKIAEDQLLLGEPDQDRGFRRASDLIPPAPEPPQGLFAPPPDPEVRQRQTLREVLTDVLRAADADRAIAETTAQTVWPRLERTAEQLGDKSLADALRVVGLGATLERLAMATYYQRQVKAIAAQVLSQLGVAVPEPEPAGFQAALDRLQQAVAARIGQQPAYPPGR